MEEKRASPSEPGYLPCFYMPQAPTIVKPIKDTNESPSRLLHPQEPVSLPIRTSQLNSTMPNKQGPIIHRPVMGTTAQPPHDHQGDPANGAAFYYCSNVGCKSIWGVAWKSGPWVQKGLHRLSDYKKNIATKKECEKCKFEALGAKNIKEHEEMMEMPYRGKGGNVEDEEADEDWELI